MLVKALPASRCGIQATRLGPGVTTSFLAAEEREWEHANPAFEGSYGGFVNPVARIFVVAITLAAPAWATERPISYEGAIAANANRPDAAAAQKWSEETLTPFLNQHLRSALESCVRPSAEKLLQTGRLVIQLDRRRVTVPLAEGAPVEFPKCLASAVQSLSWPESPFDALYVTFELNTKSLYSSEAEYEAAMKAAAERFMDDVTGHQKPPEAKHGE